MPIASLVLLTLLSRISAQDTSSAGIRAGGHTYQLFCALEGELPLASETGVCEKTETGGVQRFEVRNEAGEVQFSQDAPAGTPFTYVGIFAFANAGREILDVDTSHDETAASGAKSAHLIYCFDPAPSHLIPFNPPLVGVDGFAHVDTGLALSRTFDTGFFQFSLLLGFDWGEHRIGIMPGQIAFSAFPPADRKKSGPAAGSGLIKLYSSHDGAAAKSDVTIAAGHAVTWWQAPDIGGKTPTGQMVTILAAWAPASLKPADNAPDGVKMVYYDWNNLWLQIQVPGRTGWVKGIASFRALGLEMSSPQR
jgi:hypothetical protein